MKSRWSCRSCLTVAVLLTWSSVASGENFRLHSRVWVEDDVKPAAENVTIFQGGKVYDFLTEPQQTTIYDLPRGDHEGQFVLLDAERKIQCELPLKDVSQFANSIKVWTAGRNDPFLNFLANPTFKETIDPATDEAVFTSEWMVYRIAGKRTPSAQLFQQYDEFSGWFAKLNIMLTVQSQPPKSLARLAVNDLLRPRQEIPTAVKLLIPGNGKLLKKTSFRSEHLLATKFSASDKQRLDKIGDGRATFKKVAFGDYVQPFDPIAVK